MKLLLLAASLAGTAIAGSALAGETPVAPAPVTTPAAPAATDAAADFAAGEGRDKVVATCAACHPATMVTGKRYSEEKWSEVVDQMISKGAMMGDGDYDVIVAYLARTYGEVKGG
ncbi:MAG: hypothetical protein KGL44_07185 [Sphingomonadales bacterium]|nr:hypothetical protein [Sphingomonadales bacterium]